MNNCKNCNDNRTVINNHELICMNCGTVMNIVNHIDDTEFMDHNTITPDNQIGSKNIIDDDLDLKTLKTFKSSNMISSKNQYISSMSMICDILDMSKSLKDNTLHMFRKLLPKKLGVGKTAVFCVLQSYINTNIKPKSEDIIINTIRKCFKLKRLITIRDSIRIVKPVAKEMNLVYNEEFTNSFLLRTYVKPEYHIQAVKIMNSMKHLNNKKRAKIAQEYLSNLG